MKVETPVTEVKLMAEVSRITEVTLMAQLTLITEVSLMAEVHAMVEVTLIAEVTLRPSEMCLRAEQVCAVAAPV